jgi:hypothetical protein
MKKELIFGSNFKKEAKTSAYVAAIIAIALAGVFSWNSNNLWESAILDTPIFRSLGLFMTIVVLIKYGFDD